MNALLASIGWIAVVFYEGPILESPPPNILGIFNTPEECLVTIDNYKSDHPEEFLKNEPNDLIGQKSKVSPSCIYTTNVEEEIK